MIRNQKIKGTVICGPLLFKWMSVFQSWLDCFSIWVWAFIQNIIFFFSVVFVYWYPFVTIFKCCNLQSHYPFFRCIKLHQILSQFSSRNIEQVRDINIFGRDYSNLNNPISSKDINLQYIYKVYCREKRQHLMQQKSLKKYPT